MYPYSPKKEDKRRNMILININGPIILGNKKLDIPVNATIITIGALQILLKQQLHQE